MATTNTYNIGDIVVMTAQFVVPATGEGVSPGSVVCTIVEPNGKTTHTPVVSSGTNSLGQPIYTAEWAPTVAGTWFYAFDGTGTYQASSEQPFEVSSRNVPR